MNYETFKIDIELIAYGSIEFKPEHGLEVEEPFDIYDEGAPDFLGAKWISNGASGGTCWGDQPHSLGSDAPQDISVILALYLETHIPNISFLQYNKLQKVCISSSKTDENEYYGNWYEYTWSILNLQLLYQLLQEMDYIND